MPLLHNYLNRLEFENSTLLVKVKNIHFEMRTNGTIAIDGNFVIDSINNDVKDIQNCLGNPFEKKPRLYYDTKSYDIVITSVTWGDVQERQFSHFVSYECRFIAYQFQEEVPGNQILWDTSGELTYTINDVSALVGLDDLQNLEKEVIKLIEDHRYFSPTIECPSPSSIGTHAHDLAAVLAGRKPAAMFNEAELIDPLLVLMCVECYARGFKLETVENFNKIRYVVVGETHNVKEIVEIVRQAVLNNSVNDYYYWKIGKLLGYPEDTMKKVNDNLRDFGFNSKI